jgi:hypothetical protein
VIFVLSFYVVVFNKTCNNICVLFLVPLFDIFRAKRNKIRGENVNEKVENSKRARTRGFLINNFSRHFLPAYFSAIMDINFINLNLARELC